jgi:hypothetical protein
VPLLVDGDVVVTAAVNVTGHAGACRALAAEVSGLADVAAMGNIVDTDVRAGVGELADVCADVLELVGIDLDLVAARMSAGSRLYSAVEAAVAAAIRSRRR